MGASRGIPSVAELREVLGPILTSFESVEAATVEIGPATEGMRACLAIFSTRVGHDERRMIDALSLELQKHFRCTFSLFLRQWHGRAQTEGLTVVYSRERARAAAG